MKLGEAFIEIKTKGLKRFERSVKTAHDRIVRAAAGMRKGFNKLKDSIFGLKGAFAALGIGLLAKQFLNAANITEQYRTRLKVLLGSVAEGNRLFERMSDYAGRVPFQYQEIMGAATQLSGVMKKGVDEISRWMPMIGDLAAASGLDIQKTTEQVIRMYSAGAASADLFRERGILAMIGFQAGVSYSAEETRKIMMREWKKAGSQFHGATAELAKTWSGTMSMFADAWFQFRDLVMKSGPFDILRERAKALFDEISRLKKEGKVEEWARKVAAGILTIFSVVTRVIEIVINSVRSLQLLFSGIVAGITTIADKAMPIIEKIRGRTGTDWSWEGVAGKQLQKDYGLEGIKTEIGHLRQAGIDMSNDLIDRINKTAETFSKMRQEIEKVRESLGKDKTEEAIGGSKGKKRAIVEIDKEWERIEPNIYAGVDRMAEKFRDFTFNTQTQWEKMSGNIVKGIEDWGSSFSNMLNEMLWGADVTFGDIARSFGMMITRMVIETTMKEQILPGIMGFIKNLIPHARGGIIDKPTFFPMGSGGIGLAGEAGTEAILPLKRTKSGNLGVEAEGGGGGKNFIVYMPNPTFQDVKTQRQVMAQIATTIAARVAPGAVVNSYNNDGKIRQIIQNAR